MVQLIETVKRYWRPPDYWRPNDYAERLSVDSSHIEERRQLAADQFTICVSNIATEWQHKSTRSQISNALGQEAGYAPSLAVMVLGKHLFTKDFAGTYGPRLGDAVFDYMLRNYIKLSNQARDPDNIYLVGSSDVIAIPVDETARVAFLSKIGLTEKWFQGFNKNDQLREYFSDLGQSELEAMPMEFAKMMYWLFASPRDELAPRDLILITAFFKLNTRLTNISVEALASDDVRPLALLGKDLMREGRKPTKREMNTVRSIIMDRFD